MNNFNNDPNYGASNNDDYSAPQQDYSAPQQDYSAPQQDSTQSATPSSSPQQTGGDIIIPISIGDETIETVVVNAVTRANAASGGWSV